MPTPTGMQLCLRIISSLDIILFLGVLIGSAISEKYLCHTQPFPLPYFLNETEANEFQSQGTIWDYRLSLLETATEYGTEAYHFIYICIWFIIVAYFVLEIWLYCVLQKAIFQKRVDFCRKWMTWKFLLLFITLGLCLYDISRYQLTCTDVLVVPFGIFRVFHFLHVLLFTSKIKKGASTDTIIMIGSEKL